MPIDRVGEIMTYFSTSTRVYRDYEGERRQQSTVSHVVRGWFPVDGQILRSIQDSVRDGVYIDDANKFITDIKTDPALCASIFGKLTHDDAERSPIRRILAMTEAERELLIPKSQSEISKHSILKGTPIIKSSFACAITSSAASDAFADEASKRGLEIETLDAYPSALLRQLGMQLLAWNYPALFSRIVSSAKRGGTIEESCERLLGFTPMQLSRRVVQSWNLSSSITNTLEAPHPFERENILRDVCEFGELFGKKQHRALYPEANREWEERKEHLLALIGTENVSEIEERVEAEIEHRLECLFHDRPDHLNVAFSLLRESAPLSIWIDNPFLRGVAPQLAEKFEHVYDELKREPKGTKALSVLTRETIPSTGFTRGIICLEVEESSTLFPAVKIGLQSRDTAVLRSLANSAAESRESSVPLMSESNTNEGSMRIASSFESPSCKGVLVLELDRSEVPSDQVMLFKAVRDCLIRCLA